MIGQTIAHYSVTAKLGAGGMGEVFRARDTKLNRDVALKILPEVYARDAQRMGRFRREAQLLASLNHANIASIHGLEEDQGIHALVLELIEGEDLAEMLSNRAPSVDEAVEIAIQIAEALESAHERGVIHRDLKPANVKITPEGKVKVLDFGLAKALAGDSDADASEVSQSMSPTMTVAATGAGLILGTAAYMSPEQARGKKVDRRADIWAFGVVLFELLARKQLFSGETVSDTLAAVIKDEPDWNFLPADTPPLLAELIRRCLEKDPRRRLQSIGEARIALEDVLRGGGQGASILGSSIGTAKPAADAAPGAAGSSRARVLWIAALAVAAVAGWALGSMLHGDTAPTRARKFHVEPLNLSVAYPTQPALSPDGRHIVYMADGDLWVRDLEQLDAVRIPGTNLATAPFWSPDSRWLAFGQSGRIYKVPVTGGSPVAVCDVRFGVLDGGCWTEEDVLFLAPSSGPMYRVSAHGGDPRVVFELEDGESDFHTPTALPGGRGILFTTHNEKGRQTIEALVGGERKVVLEIDGARLEYATCVDGEGSGHFLVYHRLNSNTGVWAAPFDPGAAELTGEPFVLDPDGAYPSVARDGSLLYATGSGGGMRQLVVVDREGAILEEVGQPQTGMRWPALSPDGRYVLVSATETDNTDIWLHDIERGTRTRLTFGEDAEYFAAWANGGRDVVFTNGSAQTNVSWVRPVDGSREAEALVNGYFPSIRDGVELMVYDKFRPGTGTDLFYCPVGAPEEEKPFLETGAAETGAQLSPDGRYVAYMSNESGANEVYLKSFPEGAGKWQVSTNGGAWPRWERSGNAIIYRENSGAGGSIMEVAVQTDPAVRLGTPRRLFGSTEAPDLDFGSGYTSYETMDDPDRLLMLRLSGQQPDRTVRMVYLENWLESYRRSLN